jgi:hypothetical protein
MIIGLTGYAQSGKDTVAKILVDNYGYQRIAFADKIRELLYETSSPKFIKSLVDQVGWEEAKQYEMIREALQRTGVAARKVFGEDFWISQAFSGRKEIDNLVITDVRFTNEADYIKWFPGSQLWRIKRSGVEAVNSHISETQLDGYPVDQILVNNGTIADLEALVLRRLVGLSV